MNSGTSSTELNDMFTQFVDYVDSFYGVNDPLYPLVKDGKPAAIWNRFFKVSNVIVRAITEH